MELGSALRFAVCVLVGRNAACSPTLVSFYVCRNKVVSFYVCRNKEPFRYVFSVLVESQT